MNIIYTDFSLDFTINRSLYSIPIKQNDTGARVLRISLTHNGTPVALSSGSGDSALLYASIGSVATAIGTLLTIIDNKIIIPITSELSAISGIEHCEVRVYNTHGCIHTARFNLDVGKASADSSMPSVIATADIVEAVDEFPETLAAYIKNSADAMNYSTVTYTQTVDASTASLAANPPTIVISATDFDPTKDGLYCWKNGTEFIMREKYSFDTTSVAGGVVVTFSSPIHFDIGDTFVGKIYKNAVSGSGGGGGSGQLANNLSPIAVTNGGGVVPVTFSNNYSTFEICVAYTFNGSPTYSAGAALCGGSEYTNCPTMEIVTDNGGSMFYGFCSRNGSGWDHIGYANISSYITADTTGYFRIKYDGSAVTLSHSTDGINFTPVDSFSATGAPNVSGVLEIGHCGGSSGDHWFNTAGTINFADCYVMLDDELVWGNNALVSPRGSCVVTCSGATYNAMQTHSDKILYVIT